MRNPIHAAAKEEQKKWDKEGWECFECGEKFPPGAPADRYTTLSIDPVCDECAMEEEDE